jgi:uncharacterized protein (TIRG00374 family)
MKVLRRLLPVIISGALIVILIGYAPWPQVGDAISDMRGQTFLVLLVLSLAYFGLKIVRFWVMTRALDIKESLGIVAVSYLAAQPVSLLPAGEIYRARMLQRLTGTSFRQALPTFTMQGLFETTAMVALAAVSTFIIGSHRLPVIIAMAALLLVFIAIRRGYLTAATRLLNALPFFSIEHEQRLAFSRGNEAMLHGLTLWMLLGLSLVTEAVGVLIAYVSVIGLGAHISFYQAVILYVVPVFVGFVSLLPGGLGSSEQSAVGILLLDHTTVTVAVAATLLMRVTLVGTGFIYGLLTQAGLGVYQLAISAKRD